jgi:hypothetical protein
VAKHGISGVENLTPIIFGLASDFQYKLELGGEGH